MKTQLKAALAAAAAGTLLLGGAGSVAYWNDAEDALPQTTITSGSLDLGTPLCPAGWLLENGDAFTPASSRLVPGDTLTRTCTFLLTAIGSHLTVNLTAGLPSITDSLLEDELSIGAVYELDTDATNDGTGETAVTPAVGAVALTPADNGHYLRSIVTVTFPRGVLDNDSNGGVPAVLNQIVVTATQTAH